MSYDLNLLHVPLGERARDVLNRRIADQEWELNPGPTEIHAERDKHRLAAALTLLDAELSIAPFDFEAIALREHIDLAEAGRRYRHLELNGADYSGIQITLWDYSADLSFPYWHSGEQSFRVLERAWSYLEILEASGGFVTYDPQLDRLLRLEHDFETVLKSYTGGGSTHERAAGAAVGRWKLW